MRGGPRSWLALREHGVNGDEMPDGDEAMHQTEALHEVEATLRFHWQRGAVAKEELRPVAVHGSHETARSHRVFKIGTYPNCGRNTSKYSR